MQCDGAELAGPVDKIRDNKGGSIMESETNLIDRLRDRVIGGLHRGTLRGGDRLPGVRETARETGLNARTVARMYRQLEAEGLVEVRGRSGVYVARQEQRDGEMLPETARWMTGVLVEAWRRMIKLPDFPGFIRRYTESARIRCALVESVEDAVTAYSTELREHLGLDVQTVSFDSRGVQREEGVFDFGRDLGRLMDELRDADLIVTTSFYARPVRAAAEALDKPVVTLTAHPEFEAAIRRRLDEGRLTVVVTDPRFGERVRIAYGEGRGDDRIRIVLADDVGAVAELDPSEPVLLTRAAHERLGEVDLTLLFPHSPSFSPASARELAEVLIRLNREAERG
jgi:DNA-binding transcriptional regulator YhcF (GntR family)